MTKITFPFQKPGLLVSVRNAPEALTALAGGADIIDVKEPDRGPLGAADADTIFAVVRAVNSRVPVTAALGELIDLVDEQNRDARKSPLDGVSLFKIGLAGCAPDVGWRSCWHGTIDRLTSSLLNVKARPVAVVYADWLAARSPPPRDVLAAAIELRSPVLLVDTWSKSAGSLFDHWPIEDLQSFLDEVRSQNLAIVLAGSLAGKDLAAAVQLAPDLIAVRTAACDAGRGGIVSLERVRELKQAIRAASRNPAAVLGNSSEETQRFADAAAPGPATRRSSPKFEGPAQIPRRTAE